MYAYMYVCTYACIYQFSNQYLLSFPMACIKSHIVNICLRVCITQPVHIYDGIIKSVVRHNYSLNCNFIFTVYYIRFLLTIEKVWIICICKKIDYVDKQNKCLFLHLTTNLLIYLCISYILFFVFIISPFHYYV